MFPVLLKDQGFFTIRRSSAKSGQARRFSAVFKSDSIGIKVNLLRAVISAVRNFFRRGYAPAFTSEQKKSIYSMSKI